MTSSTAILAQLSSASAVERQMRDDDGALHLHDGRVGEVGHIRGHLAGLKRLGHGDVVDQHIAEKFRNTTRPSSERWRRR